MALVRWVGSDNTLRAVVSGNSSTTSDSRCKAGSALSLICVGFDGDGTIKAKMSLKNDGHSYGHCALPMMTITLHSACMTNGARVLYRAINIDSSTFLVFVASLSQSHALVHSIDQLDGICAPARERRSATRPRSSSAAPTRARVCCIETRASRGCCCSASNTTRSTRHRCYRAVGSTVHLCAGVRDDASASSIEQIGINEAASRRTDRLRLLWRESSLCRQESL